MATTDGPNRANESDKSITSGLKFNSVMQDPPAATIIRQKKDPARQMQIAIGIAVALLAMGVLGFMSWLRSGLNPFEQNDHDKNYGPGQTRKIEDQ